MSKRRKEKKIWLTENQIETLINVANADFRTKDEGIIMLGAKCGLRVSEISRTKVKALYTEKVENNPEWFIRVKGKKTNQKKSISKEELEVKEREVYVPGEVARTLNTIIKHHDLVNNDPLIPSNKGGHMNPDSIRQRIYKIAEKSYQKTGIEKFKYLSSHDLRRSWATIKKDEEGIDVWLLKNQGGWGSFEAMKPYMDKPTKKNIIKAFKK